ADPAPHTRRHGSVAIGNRDATGRTGCPARLRHRHDGSRLALSAVLSQDPAPRPRSHHPHRPEGTGDYPTPSEAKPLRLLVLAGGCRGRVPRPAAAGSQEQGATVAALPKKEPA